jgi:hypothetical protein
LKFDNFGMLDEAETGNAGEQPVRNNSTDWNDQEIGLKPVSNLRLFLSFMPKKTHCSLY